VVDPTRGASGTAVWTWDLTGEAFGNTAPNQDPDGDATNFVFDMRFPGQRYDAASGLSYNYFRDYDPSTGRYVQSDPIGLAAGISTYGYVAGSPLGAVDPYGLSDRRWWDAAGQFGDWMDEFQVDVMAHAYVHGMNHVTPETKEFVDQRYYKKLNQLGSAIAFTATAFMPAAAAEGAICYGSARQGASSFLRAGSIRVRHHTSREGLAAIRRQGAINPSRGGGVHVEISPFGIPRTAAQETGAFGRGAYVEFNSPGNVIPTFVGPRSTGVIPTASPLPISGANPIFYTRPWWRF
jgi:RHS repeat-associated protein